MPNHTSETNLPDLDCIPTNHSERSTPPVSNEPSNGAANGGSKAISTFMQCPPFRNRSPSFCYPDLRQLQPVRQDIIGFQGGGPEDEDFYETGTDMVSDTVSDTSSSPILASHRRPEFRTSSAPEDCACVAPWHSEPDGEGEEKSFHADDGTLLSTQVPWAPANSSHDEQQAEANKSYDGPSGSSTVWPHYLKPTVEDEEEDTIMCHDSDVRTLAEPQGATSLPRSQSSGWLQGRLERTKNAFSASTLADVQIIDDVKSYRAAHLAQNVDDISSDPELQYWSQKRQEMLKEIQQVDEWQARFGQPPVLSVSKSGTSRLSEGECMVNMMYERGFEPTPKWLAEYLNVAELAERGITYPLMAFVIAEFGEFFSQDEESTSENCQSQEQLDTATYKGVIDACQAVKSIISIGSSHPNEAWCKQFDALATNARDGGDLKPLIEFVQHEAQNVSARNAIAKAAKAKDSLRQNYNNIDLDESGNQNRYSLRNGPAVGYGDDQNGKASGHSQLKADHEYGIWLALNYQSETGPFDNRFFYIANSLHPIVARPDNFETKRPFVVTLNHYFDEFRLHASVSIMALALKVTPSEKQRSVHTYAEVRFGDSLYRERFDTPSKIEGFSAQGQAFNFHEEAIIAMIEANLGDQLDATAPGDGKCDSTSDSHSNGSTSTSASGTTLRRRDSDQSQSPSPSSSRQPLFHPTTQETHEMHPNVVAERGMTSVPLHDFPDIPEDPYNLSHYQLSIGAAPTSLFISCERCHKTLASFDNVETAPTVARRDEDELGDTYVVTTISSLDNIIDSVDRVKRVWLQIGMQKYFMRANEAGVERAHECISIQDTLGGGIEHEEREVAAEYYYQDDDEALGYNRIGGLQPQEPCAHGRRSFPGDEELEYDRLGDFPPYEPGQPRDHIQLPPSEEHQSQPQTIPSVRMPSDMQFLPLNLNFPTAELTSVREPCTLISVCEKRGIIHGVYQGVIGYRTIFRGRGERGHTIYLDIRDGMGGYIGRLSRIRHYEIGLMNGQVSTFTAEEEPEEKMEPMPLPRQPGQAHGMGLRGGTPLVEDWADTEADTYWSDGEDMGLRGGAGVEDSDSGDDDPDSKPKEEWISAGTTSPTPKNEQGASVSAFQSSAHAEDESIQTHGSAQKPTDQKASAFTSQSTDPLKEEWVPAGAAAPAPTSHQAASVSASQASSGKAEWILRAVSAQQTTTGKASQSASQSGVGLKQTLRPTGLSDEPSKTQQKRCTCSSRKGKEPAHQPWVPPSALTEPLMINEGADLNDYIGSLKGKVRAWDLVYGSAPEVVPIHNQQGAGPMSHLSSSKDQGPAKALGDLPVASPRQFVPSNDPMQPPLPHDGFERTPSWLQAGPQSDPDQVEGEGPVFTESYKKWLRDMYTRPPYSTCGTNPAPAPSLQDFWQNREAGRPATMADGSVFRPRGRPEGEYHGAAADEGEHTRMESDSHVGRNAEEPSPSVQSFGSNVRDMGQPHRRWHGADVGEAENFRFQKESPRAEQITYLNPELQNILKRFLRGRVLQKARGASNAPAKED